MTTPHLSRSPRVHSLSIAIFLMAALATPSGCAFIESAAEITLGDPDIPAVREEAQVGATTVNNAIANVIPSHLTQSIPGVDPSNLQQAALDFLGLGLAQEASWAHLRLVLCEGTKLGVLDSPSLTLPLTPLNPTNAREMTLSITVVAPEGDHGACLQGSLRLFHQTRYVPFTDAQAEDIQSQLGATIDNLDDAIVQVRFRFYQLGLVQHLASGTVDTNHVLSDFKLVVKDESLLDDPETPFHDGEVELVPFFLLSSISQDTPQRFELDPDAAITQNLQDTIVQFQSERDFLLQVTMEVQGHALADIPLQSSGVIVDLQPEVTISALEAISNLL